MLEPDEHTVSELNMLRSPHPRSFTFFFGEVSPFLALLENFANKCSPDRFVKLLAGKLTYLSLCPRHVVDFYLGDSLLLRVS